MNFINKAFSEVGHYSSVDVFLRSLQLGSLAANHTDQNDLVNITRISTYANTKTRAVWKAAISIPLCHNYNDQKTAAEFLRQLQAAKNFTSPPAMLGSSILRASSSTSSVLTSRTLLKTLGTSKASPIACASAVQTQQSRRAHAISNPTLAQIEKRWEAMPPQEQADLWMQLRDRMKTDWHELTMNEKKAAYWIAFGPHGPRAVTPPGEGWRVFWITAAGVSVSFFIFIVIRQFARPPPKTMTKEYQEMTNEYLKNQNTEPISGISSEGYKGKGMVQSGPAKK